jgi:hypothetical protein
MFEGDAGNSANWKLNWNTLVGGINYQHPHTDTGRTGTYQNLDVFPFVALHGFGLDLFSLWLLPEPFELRYGFLHTFESHQMLLMRGDFVHAGVPSNIPRVAGPIGDLALPPPKAQNNDFGPWPEFVFTRYYT